MKLGDAQSIFQLSVALNLAFFTFREIRAPGVARVQKQASRVVDAISGTTLLLSVIAKPDRMGLFDEASTLYSRREWLEPHLNMHLLNVQPYIDPWGRNFREFDEYFRKGCLVAGGISWLLLYGSTVFSTFELSSYAFAPIAVALLLPILAALVYNNASLIAMRDEESEVQRIRSELEPIVKEVTDDLMPRFRKLVGLSNAGSGNPHGS